MTAIGNPSAGRVRSSPERLTIVAGTAVLIAVAILSLAVGPTGISLDSLPKAATLWLGGEAGIEGQRASIVLLDVRLPRTLLGLLVGAFLAVAGALMQGLFRNPLADPGLVGVSAGAALAAVATIALGNGLLAGWSRTFGLYALPFAAFTGGLATTMLLVLIASRRGELAVATLLLSGIAVGAIAGALTGLISYASDDRELRDLTLWSMGSLSGASWPKLLAILPFGGALLLAVPRLTAAMNGFLLGESEAFHLGIDVETAKRVVVAVTAAAVGAAVAVSGVIGFVGLVAPHIVRLLAGPDHRVVLPGAAILGAILVLAADILARMIVRPAELPIGIVMAAIGAPFLLYLVAQRGAGAGD